MKILSIDLETYSSEDLTKAGVYRYASAPDFRILLFGYAFDDEEVQVVDLACGEELPAEVMLALRDDSVVKSAFNASFERVCLSRYLKQELSPVSWQCTAVRAAVLGLPLNLEGVGEVLGLAQQKMKEGKELIRLFSGVRYPGISGMPEIPGYLTPGDLETPRYLVPGWAPEWERFKEYCKRDVEVERAIRKKLEKYPVSAREQALYILDQEINDRGILVDKVLVGNAVRCGDLHKQGCYAEAQRLTGLSNPNSVQQLKQWLSGRGLEVKSLSRKNVTALAAEEECDEEVKELLDLRLQLSKTSIKKYEAIERAVCPDGRVRGLFQFYGANRTGRWAGRLVQVHNLPQNHLKDLTLARELVKKGCFQEIEMLYGSVPEVLSELIRTAFVPRAGCRFIAADFSAVEARVLSWLAGEGWRMEVFAGEGKIYEASASRMFRVAVESINKDSLLRQKGKIAELALGYGGSVGALIAMGALESGLKSEELYPLVKAWRGANSRIVRFWWDVEKAAMRAVRERVPQSVGGARGAGAVGALGYRAKIRFYCSGGVLFVTLPSGRSLAYVEPRIEWNKVGHQGLTFSGIGENKRWCRIETYGPKLVENIVQAISRDLLAEAMMAVSGAGYRILLHVHDEVLVEVGGGSPAFYGDGSKEFGKGDGSTVFSGNKDEPSPACPSCPTSPTHPPKKSLHNICTIMEHPPSWAKGLPLKVDGFECQYYRKE